MIGQEARIPGYRIHDAGFRILRVGIPRGLEDGKIRSLEAMNFRSWEKEELFSFP